MSLSNSNDICARFNHTVSFSNLTSSEMVLSSLVYIAMGLLCACSIEECKDL